MLYFILGFLLSLLISCCIFRYVYIIGIHQGRKEMSVMFGEKLEAYFNKGYKLVKMDLKKNKK